MLATTTAIETTLGLFIERALEPATRTFDATLETRRRIRRGHVRRTVAVVVDLNARTRPNHAVIIRVVATLSR